MVDSSRANTDTASRIGTVITQANERLYKLQAEAVKAAFAENSKDLQALLRTTDPGALFAQWANIYQANARRFVEVTSSYFEIVSETQAEISRLMGERFSAYNKGAQRSLDEFTKSVNERRDAAVADFLDMAGEDVSGREAARKQKAAV